MPNYGSFTYNKLQLGRESTAGTAVAATDIWRGPFGDILDDRQRQIAEENVGLLVNAERSYDTRIGAMLTMPSTELTFEQVLHILEAGIKTATPVDNTGDYTYSYPFPTGATPNAIKTYTIEAGNAYATGDVREMPYAFVEGFTLSGQEGEAWMMTANWRGQRVIESSFTGALSLQSVEEAIFNNTLLYIDASGGTIGSTQKAGVLVAASIEVDTGIRIVPVGDGNLYYTAHKFHRPSLNFTLTMELESGNIFKTERDAFEADSIRLLRLSCDGTANRNLTVDISAKYDSVPGYQDSDGNTTIQIAGHAAYSSADSLFAQFDVTNLLDAVA